MSPESNTCRMRKQLSSTRLFKELTTCRKRRRSLTTMLWSIKLNTSRRSIRIGTSSTSQQRDFKKGLNIKLSKSKLSINLYKKFLKSIFLNLISPHNSQLLRYKSSLIILQQPLSSAVQTNKSLTHLRPSIKASPTLPLPFNNSTNLSKIQITDHPSRRLAVSTITKDNNLLKKKKRDS